MRKFLISAIGVFAFGVTHAFAFQIPEGIDALRANAIDDFGASVLTTQFSTTPIFVGGSSIAVLAVMTSTPAWGCEFATQSCFVEIRASNTATATGDLLVPAVYVSSNPFPQQQRNTLLVYPMPPIAHHGLSVRTTTASIVASVFYIHVDTDAQPLFMVPLDNFGNETLDRRLFGVEVTTGIGAGSDQTSGLGYESFDYITDARKVTPSTHTTKGLLYGHCSGTGSLAGYVVYEDSAGINTTPTYFLPPLFYNVTDQPAFESLVNRSNCFAFPFPVRFERGLNQRRPVDLPRDQFRVLARPVTRIRW